MCVKNYILITWLNNISLRGRVYTEPMKMCNQKTIQYKKQKQNITLRTRVYGADESDANDKRY